ncbi:MAG: YSC84-related protein [Sulfuricellaceae bacterium]|nr:YSC84-related protein [Sulfuricellaceae bacterium]
MNAYRLIGALGLAILLMGAGSTFAASDKEAQRAEIRKTSKEILTKLYKVQPSARKAVGAAVGYAVFSNFGMKILFAGGGTGHGMVVEQATKKETFMKMVEVQAGLGMGIKKFKLVFVFQNQQALNTFINTGWEATAQTTAAAIGDDKGVSLQGAVAVSPGVWVYQITDKGLALEATIKGTKYFKNDDLN